MSSGWRSFPHLAAGLGLEQCFSSLTKSEDSPGFALLSGAFINGFQLLADAAF